MTRLIALLAALCLASPLVAQDGQTFEPLDIIEGDIPEDQVFDEDAPFDEFGNPITQDDPNDPLREGEGDIVTTVQDGPSVSQGSGALLKGLDKLAGTSMDLNLANGETGTLGWLQITMVECRYPTDNPAGDAFVHLTIQEDGKDAPIFDGWMVASSPALSALDHSRFDVWAMRCVTE